MNYYVFNQQTGTKDFTNPNDAIDFWNNNASQNDSYTSIGISKDYRSVDILFKDGPDEKDFLSKDFLSSSLLESDGKQLVEMIKNLLEALNSIELYQLFTERYLGNEVIEKINRYEFQFEFEKGNLELPYNHPFTKDEIKVLEIFYNAEHNTSSIEVNFNELKKQYINEVLKYWQSLDRNGAFLNDLSTRLHDVESFSDDVGIMENVVGSWYNDGYLTKSEFEKWDGVLKESSLKLDTLSRELRNFDLVKNLDDENVEEAEM